VKIRSVSSWPRNIGIHSSLSAILPNAPLLFNNNQICEDTSCSTGQWLECGGTVEACAGWCALAILQDAPSSDCTNCMGALYQECKGCYVSQRRRNLLMSTPDQEPESQLQQCKLDTMGKFGTDVIEEEEHLLAVFECIQPRGRNATLSLIEACDIVGCNKTAMDVFENGFNMTDKNGDGFITIGEFDSELAKYDSTLPNVLETSFRRC
jgi:hypothetical protein